MDDGNRISVLVTGERACFTRPDLKAERVSYEAMTPTAAVGVLRGVYWKPEMSWHIDAITVLHEIRYGMVMVNELGVKGSYAKARRAMRGADGERIGTVIDGARQQRLMAYLRDVAYIVDAHIELAAHATSPRNTVEKHVEIARRRLGNGQCFRQSWLGTREFACDVAPLGDQDDRLALERGGFYAQVPERDMGWMLLENDYTGKGEPRFWHAVMKWGRIAVPPTGEGARL